MSLHLVRRELERHGLLPLRRDSQEYPAGNPYRLQRFPGLIIFKLSQYKILLYRKSKLSI